MPLESLLALWRSDPDTAPNIPTWRTTPARPAQVQPFPVDLPAAIASGLAKRGITSLYSHQAEAWTHARLGENIALATGTASGKTLGYNLPVLASLLENPEARALYLFPTKALTQDQLSALEGLLIATQKEGLSNPGIKPAIYDGDTPQSQRAHIRKNSRIIFTNPDMLHTGILPHHTNWADFLRNLRFVVIDEVHSYRGVFGSHVANVIRRLKRVADFYGAQPQFVLTSATIGNPRELAERLIEAPVALVDEDGSARGERHFIIYNPPVVDEALGLRKSSVQESVRLAQDLLHNNLQSVVFARSRRSVEILLKYLQESPSPLRPSLLGRGDGGEVIRGYRSGYLPRQRREIEKGMRDGSVKMVVATNALELGIDIGGLGAALLVGYPGTIASTIQQAGRAGRGDDPALAVLVATASPLDQFLAHHPEYFFARSPEQALINPDHLLILLNHLRCAMFELPFRKGEVFGGQPVEEYLDFLVSNQESHLSNDQYFWMADSYPAAGVSLRSASPANIQLRSDQGGESATIGEIDLESASWMVHPHAVYLHEGQQYFVQDLDFERHAATLIPVALDYYTEPLRETDVSLINLLEDKLTPIATKAYGELQVTTKVKGFRKRMWLSGDNIGEEPLDLPPTELQTTGYWIAISEQTVSKLAKDGLWTNAPNDYGPEWPKIRDRIRARDGYRCQVCGLVETSGRQPGDVVSPERNPAGTKPARQPGDVVSPERNPAGTKPARQHDVHHKIPFRQFRDEGGRILRERANRPDNLVTLCPECHKKAEQNVRMRSGLAGLATVLGQLAPLYLMCDAGDLGMHYDPQAAFAGGLPAVVLFDQVPAGIGFSQKLFEIHNELLNRALELVLECSCEDGCPSCVGPAGENGVGGKQETLAILRELVR